MVFFLLKPSSMLKLEDCDIFKMTIKGGQKNDLLRTND